MIVTAFPSGALDTNTYVVADEKTGKALVIDPGACVERLLSFLAARGHRLTAIVNTHGHYDHVTGNRALKEATGAPVMMHGADSKLAGRAADLARLVSAAAEDSPPPDVILEEALEVRSGDLTFRVLHTPGHTPGSITLSGHGVLFCGDLLYAGGIGKTDLPGCSVEQLRDSIGCHILIRPDDTIIYPGHGPATVVGSERASNARLAPGHLP